MISPDDPSVLSRRVRPLEFQLPAAEKDSLSRSTKRSIDALLQSGKLDFTETTTSVTPIELDANPELAPNHVFRSLMRIPYNRAHVQMIREFHQGEPALSQANIFLYRSDLPETIGSEIHILADEYETDSRIDLDDPQFYIETPDETYAGKDVIPLDYASLMHILSGLVDQSNLVAALENQTMSIEHSLQAILEMARETSVERETTYKFNDETLRDMGHSVITIAKHLHLSLDAPTQPKLIKQDVTVENTHTLAEDGIEMSSTYVYVESDNRISSRVGVAYTKQLEPGANPDDIQAQRDELNTRYDELIMRELESHDMATKASQNSRFGSHILAALSTLANETGERVMPE